MMIVMLLGFTTHAKYIDLALSYTLCIVWSVCLLICTEMTELIMNQFRGRWVWPQKTLYTMGIQIPSRKSAILWPGFRLRSNPDSCKDKCSYKHCCAAVMHFFDTCYCVINVTHSKQVSSKQADGLQTLHTADNVASGQKIWTKDCIAGGGFHTTPKVCFFLGRSRLLPITLLLRPTRKVYSPDHMWHINRFISFSTAHG